MRDAKKPVRVLVVEDSMVAAEILKHFITKDARLSLQAIVSSAEEALRLVEKERPDVVCMDIHLPGMDGVEATRRIMSTEPLPIVIVSNSEEVGKQNASMNALRAGALAVIEKPVSPDRAEFELRGQAICTQLAIMSEVRLVRRRSFVGPRRTHACGIDSIPSGGDELRPRGPYRAVAIVASTGGPNALVAILSALPVNFPLPVFIVQHITASFSKGFVSWLSGILPLSVHAASNGVIPEPGNVYVAPADHHLTLSRNRFRLSSDPAVSQQRPSGTVLLKSMAVEFGASGIGVVLTGMGNDGAEGLLRMRGAGAFTIAESEATSVVYGMPAAAVALGAAREILPLPEIAPRLIDLAMATARISAVSAQ